jgi:hypothetical protein
MQQLCTVEVPLLTMGRFGFSTKECRDVFDVSGDDRYLQSLTRLVILKENEDANLKGCLMTIIPDLEYRTSKSFDAFKSTYKNLQQDFSGYIFYHNLDGTFSNGWKVQNGEIIKTVSQSQNSNLSLQYSALKSLNVLAFCQDVYITQYWMQCTDWYSDAAYTQYVNTTCHVYTTEGYLYTECQIVSEGGG